MSDPITDPMAGWHLIFLFGAWLETVPDGSNTDGTPRFKQLARACQCVARKDGAADLVAYADNPGEARAQILAIVTSPAPAAP